MLELLRGGDADPAVAAIAAVLSRVAATLIVIVILLVLRMALALLTLLLTSLALTPLGRPVVAEGLDECRRPVGLAEDCDGLHCNVDRDESEHTNACLQRFTQDAHSVSVISPLPMLVLRRQSAEPAAPGVRWSSL